MFKHGRNREHGKENKGTHTNNKSTVSKLYATKATPKNREFRANHNHSSPDFNLDCDDDLLPSLADKNTDATLKTAISKLEQLSVSPASSTSTCSQELELELVERMVGINLGTSQDSDWFFGRIITPDSSQAGSPPASANKQKAIFEESETQLLGVSQIPSACSSPRSAPGDVHRHDLSYGTYAHDTREIPQATFECQQIIAIDQMLSYKPAAGSPPISLANAKRDKFDIDVERMKKRGMYFTSSRTRELPKEIADAIGGSLDLGSAAIEAENSERNPNRSLVPKCFLM